MRSDEAELSRWREELARPGGAPRPDECPPPERLWEAVAGALPPGEVREVVEHVASCAACAEDWRLAVAMAPPVARPVELELAARAPARRWRGAWVAAAAAVFVAAAIGGPLLLQRQPFRPLAPGQGSEFRGGLEEIRSPDNGRTLPRSQFLLRWNPVPEAISSDIEVFSDASELVSQKDGIPGSQYLVPPADLQILPPGSKLYWRVTFNLPEGRQLPSPTFETRLR